MEDFGMGKEIDTELVVKSVKIPLVDLFVPRDHRKEKDYYAEDEESSLIDNIEDFGAEIFGMEESDPRWQVMKNMSFAEFEELIELDMEEMGKGRRR
jgi:hypothetical protein